MTVEELEKDNTRLREELAAAKERLQIAEQTIEVKQPGFDMYYHGLFREQMALRKTAEKELAEAQQDARQMFTVFKDLRKIVANMDGRFISVEQVVAVFSPLRWEPKGTPPPKWLDPLKAAESRASALRDVVSEANADMGAVEQYLEDGHEASALAQLRRGRERLAPFLAPAAEAGPEGKK
jgi:hypothetical protein